MSYKKKIEQGLLLWLKEERGIEALYAELCESEVERSYYEGCETCGYGGQEDTITTSIVYKTKKVGGYGTAQIEGTSINFLPKLLEYIDRASE